MKDAMAKVQSTVPSKSIKVSDPIIFGKPSGRLSYKTQIVLAYPARVDMRICGLPQFHQCALLVHGSFSSTGDDPLLPLLMGSALLY